MQCKLKERIKDYTDKYDLEDYGDFRPYYYRIIDNMKVNRIENVKVEINEYIKNNKKRFIAYLLLIDSLLEYRNNNEENAIEILYANFYILNKLFTKSSHDLMLKDAVLRFEI